MNDFLKAMGQFGMEGLGLDHEENVSLEQEMNEEIAMEAELDESYAQMDFANIVASTSQCEAILTAMAEREVGLESNEGRDAGEIYKEFGLGNIGMEAVKDVVTRKVYSGVASLKALINTCIKWLKQLVGISVASKKIFAGLAKKAKAMNKQLSKVQSKVTDKLTRDLPDYAEVLQKLLKEYTDHVSRGALTNRESFDLTRLDGSALQKLIDVMKSSNDNMPDAMDNLKEIYDKSEKDEYEGAACYQRIKTAVRAIESAGNTNKSVDMAKNFEKEIKSLEKLRDDIDKKDFRVTSPEQLKKYISVNITYATKIQNYAKLALKNIVKVADDCLTMAKGIYATLV